MALLAELVGISRRVGTTPGRRAKIEAIAGYLRALPPAEAAIAAAYLSGEPRQERLGIGHAALRAALPQAAAGAPALTLPDVDDDLSAIAGTAGPGSARARTGRLRALLERATRDEQDFLVRLLLGELRQGALEGLMIEALAAAAGLPGASVRRAAMLGGGVGAVAHPALAHGEAGLAAFAIRLFQPLAPMLAQPADDLTDALARIPAGALEWKLDGARVQVHRHAAEVRIFSRTGNDVTLAAPEIVAAVRALPVGTLILDGEAIALRHDGMPCPFQDTMRRFGRVQDIDRMRTELPLSVFFFDCLRCGDDDLIAQPASARYAALAGVLPAALRAPRLVTGEIEAAQAFYDDALRRGHEGIMVKALEAPYDPGARSAQWLKVKRTHTLDLVVLAAEWGHGRRRGWLSNLHLGARDPVTGGFVMLGKTFKGMTDAMLEWQTGELLARATQRDEWMVQVRPELVVEIAFNDLQASARYPGGLALRFARVKGYRPDKKAQEADTIDTVRAIYAAQPPAAGR